MNLILLELAFAFFAPAADEIKYFVHLSFNSTLQLTNSISSDLQKLLKYFHGTSIVAFFKILLASPVSVLYNNLDLCIKDLKLLILAIPAFKLVASSFE